MPKKPAKKPADFIMPLYINGMSGRTLRMPAPKKHKREILFIYGIHTSLERYFGVVDFLNSYGAVTIPDLPGFGGMDSFYRIGEKLTLDNLADYLAAFIKLRYKKKRFVIAGYSLGVAIYTHMLQKHPEIAKQVDFVISCGGFVHKEDFRFKKRNYWFVRICSSLFALRFMSAFIRILVLREPQIRATYKVFEKKHPKFTDANDADRRYRIDFEVKLWKINDVRTYMTMVATMMMLDLTKGGHINLPVYHVGMDNDWYFDNTKVEQHMRAIYRDFRFFKAKALAHSPTVVATAEEAAPFVPPPLRKILMKGS